MFSKACEYAIKATLHIAHQSRAGRRASLKDIAKAIDSPEAFTAKILQKLAHGGIVLSMKGPAGGFAVPEAHFDKITLNDIVRAIDGDSLYKACVLGLRECGDRNPCPVHHKFQPIKAELEAVLKTTSLQMLIDQLERGGTYIKWPEGLHPGGNNSML